ncbi:MAG: HAMP domain-containing protein [Lentisphaeria bacterium]|nr:HAMP domain-containing protein [Lentisphaeria bacterium]
MSWSRLRPTFGTLRARLVLWYALLFAGLAAILFATGDAVLHRALRERTDDMLLESVREFDALYEEFGLKVVADEFRRDATSAGAENVVLAMVSPKLTLLASSDLSAWPGLLLPDESLRKLMPGEARLRTLDPPGLDTALRLAEARSRDGNYIQVGRSLRADAGIRGAFRWSFGGAVSGTLLLGSVLCWGSVSRALHGVAQVTSTALRIGRSDLAERVPAGHRGREIETLVTAFNGMLDRIDRVVTELRDMTSNVAHDLRSPLTRVRAAAETALRGADTPSATREALVTVIEECDRLVHLIDTMLDIAEVQAGIDAVTRREVDLGALLGDAFEVFRPVAEDCGLEWTLEAPAEGPSVLGDRARLQRAVSNLIDNALKYTPAGGRVALEAGVQGNQACVCVADTGVGMAPEELGRAFERFYRADSSRSTPGNGLGLSLADAIVRAHGGGIELSSVRGKGCRALLRLPLAARSAGAGPSSGSAAPGGGPRAGSPPANPPMRTHASAHGLPDDSRGAREGPGAANACTTQRTDRLPSAWTASACLCGHADNRASKAWIREYRQF